MLPTTEMMSRDRETHRAAYGAAAALIALGIVSAAMETFLPNITGAFFFPPMQALQIDIGLAACIVAFFAGNRFAFPAWRTPLPVIALAVGGSLLAGFLAHVAWPNSGDEYSYLFLADTLRAGRLLNPAPPDPALFETTHVLLKGTSVFSAYPFGWPLLLVPFRALDLVWLVNPSLTGLLGVALVGALRHLRVSVPLRNAALALVLLAPFTLFLGGSLFPHTLMATVAACIVWIQLADEMQPRMWRKCLIGCLFGVLLISRYDVFPLVALPYAIDRLVKRRTRAIADSIPVLFCLLPFVVGIAVYNAGITGSPFNLPALSASPALPGFVNSGDSLDLSGPGPGLRGIYWLASLAQFGGFPVLILSMIGVARKLRARSLRFYDVLLPLTVLFYLFIPFSGGYQYGPRYWFWAWPLAMLTATSALADGTGNLPIFGRRVTFQGFAAACLVYGAAAFAVLVATTRVHMEARHEVFAGALPQRASVILVPDRLITLWPWQGEPIQAASIDFTHNGISFDGRVLYGRGDLPDAVSRACRQRGRDVFRWVAPGQLSPVSCP